MITGRNVPPASVTKVPGQPEDSVYYYRGLRHGNGNDLHPAPTSNIIASLKLFNHDSAT